MRADLLKLYCSHVSPRAAALAVLVSDYETKKNIKGDGWGTTPRTLKSLQEYNPRISRKTLWRLVDEDLAECVGLSYKLKVE